MRPTLVEGSKYLSWWFYKQYTARRFTIEQWLCFLKINHLDYYDVEICSNWLTNLPKNSFILDQLSHINNLESDFSNLRAHFPPRLQAILVPMGNPACAINCQPVRLSNSISDGKFNNDILDSLVPDLVPNFNKLDLLSCKVHYQQCL